MTAPWYVTDADEDSEYIPAEQVETCEHCRGSGTVMVAPSMGAAPWDESVLVECGMCEGAGRWDSESSHAVTVATCSLCDGEIPEGAAQPLCARCSQTARAHGRLEAERTRQVAAPGAHR